MVDSEDYVDENSFEINEDIDDWKVAGLIEFYNSNFARDTDTSTRAANQVKYQ
jgi:hypothetical protein